MPKLKAKNLKSYSPVYDPETEVIVDYQDVVLEGWASTEKRDDQGDVLTKEYYTGLGKDVFAEFLKPLGAAIMDICHKASPSNPGGQEAESVCGHYTVCEWRENSDYDPNRMDAKGKAFRSVYMSIEGRCVMSKGGYHSFPISVGRYDQTPGEVYGRSPAMMVLPALKTINAQKAVFLKVIMKFLLANPI